MTENVEEFVARYGGIYEHSPWVAQEAAAVTPPDADVETLATIMAACVDEAARDRQLELIRAHPDLADRARVAGELTAESSAEQASAGLDRCTTAEYERFRQLNAAYRARFGFPFVMAVRNRSRQDILAAFEARLQNPPDVEFATALAEIHAIARLRLRTLEADR